MQKFLIELQIAKEKLAFQNQEMENRAAELDLANIKLSAQNLEKDKRAAELATANVELVFQNREKENRAAELVLANIELAFQKIEKDTRAIELAVAHKELAYQKLEKENRSAEFRSVNHKFNLSKNILHNNLKEISDYKYALDEAAIIAIADHNGIIKKVNANFCKLSKYCEEELVGQDFRIINSSHHSKAFMRNLWAIITSGEIWKGEVKNKAKDGTLFWVQTTIVPFLNSQGKPYQYLSIRTDITKRKEAEEDLLQRTAQLRSANKKLAAQNQQKENRAAELAIANEELAYQNQEKENRAAELAIANKELAYQNQEKENRAAELIIANQELVFQNNEKENRATELAIANQELAYQNLEKENRATELATANAELEYQNQEKENRAAELAIANKELAYQNQEKENRAAELHIANQELVFQNNEKENRAIELIIANKELAFQNAEKENRASELFLANTELAFQNDEKEHRAAELVVANEELLFQNIEKENRAAELVVANIELAFQNDEKEKRAADLAILSGDLKTQQEELSYANRLLIKQEEKVRIINQGLEERVLNRTKELAESEIRFRNMMETIPQIAWTSTVEGKVTFYNKRWNDYTGLDIEQTKNVGLKSVIHPDDMQTAIEQYQYISEGNDDVEFQIRGKRADGTYRWHLIRLLPIKNENGERQLWVGTATDIQELKLLQQQKDDFISIASHELKTPLTVLKASLQLLNRIKDDPALAMPNVLTLANKSVEKLSTLVQDLLFVSKMNEGQLHITRASFVLADLISECCHYAPEYGVHTINIRGDKNLEVFADAARIEQIVINFVNNAIKYAPESKKILIDISILNGMAKVSVTDKGPGIPSEKLPHLFDRYYRADSSGNQYSGLGLGLYISSEIIKKHNGKIGVNSVLGEGSTFWFSLPLI